MSVQSEDPNGPGTTMAPGIPSLPLTAEAVGSLLSRAYLVYRFQFAAQAAGDERRVQAALKELPGDVSHYLQAIFRLIGQVAQDTRSDVEALQKHEHEQLAEMTQQLKAARHQLVELQSDANKAFENFQRLSTSIPCGNRKVLDGLRSIERQLAQDERTDRSNRSVWLPLTLALGLVTAFASLWWLGP